MLLRNTLLYLPAQIVGPLAQLVAMIVWTHAIDEPTLGVITLIRLFRLGDSADYDSIAFFGYAALLCSLFLLLDARLPLIASLGSGSYFIYLWHIFLVMLLRDHAPLRELGSVAASTVTYVATTAGSVLALVMTREFASPRLCRWLGA